jgi:hypothetical protein
LAAKEKIIADLDFVSDRISNQARTVALSVLAIVWLFAIGGKDTPVLPTAPNRALLLLAGACCLFALFVDYLQYVAGYFTTRNVLAKGEKENLTDLKYEYHAFTYRLRTWFFWLKQALVVIGFFLLAFVIAASVFGIRAPTGNQTTASKPVAPETANPMPQKKMP